MSVRERKKRPVTGRQDQAVLCDPTQEVAILKTLPYQFFREMSKRDFLESFVNCLNNDTSGEHYWLFPMGGKPTKPVHHVYLVIGNRIRYRANIAAFEDGGERTFDDGRSMTAKAWMIVTGPVIKAPEKLHRRGFQGFRYTQPLF